MGRCAADGSLDSTESGVDSFDGEPAGKLYGEVMGAELGLADCKVDGGVLGIIIVNRNFIRL